MYVSRTHGPFVQALSKQPLLLTALATEDRFIAGMLDAWEGTQIMRTSCASGLEAILHSFKGLLHATATAVPAVPAGQWPICTPQGQDSAPLDRTDVLFAAILAVTVNHSGTRHSLVFPQAGHASGLCQLQLSLL